MLRATVTSAVEGRTAQTSVVGPGGGTGEFVCLDVNTEPGMAEISILPELAALAGHCSVS